jgi:4a-hydroxytetrahydrobiopterin dehydratase
VAGEKSRQKAFLFLFKNEYFVKKKQDMSWNEENHALAREFEFKDFSEAFAFMCRVAMLAEKMDHHPEWSNVYNRVSIRLTTHEHGNTISEKDRELAQAIDKLI